MCRFLVFILHCVPWIYSSVSLSLPLFVCPLPPLLYALFIPFTISWIFHTIGTIENGIQAIFIAINSSNISKQTPLFLSIINDSVIVNTSLSNSKPNNRSFSQIWIDFRWQFEKSIITCCRMWPQIRNEQYLNPSMPCCRDNLTDYPLGRHDSKCL